MIDEKTMRKYEKKKRKNNFWFKNRTFFVSFVFSDVCRVQCINDFKT